MIEDLCIIMLTAGITSLLFKLFKQPVVLGYIVAGMLVGPHMLGESWISNEQSVDTWGEIGVLFLLFSLGLEFSFKKLIQVGSTALIGAGIIVAGMMTSGFIVGKLFGWSDMNALFLGGMLCMSSTTIVFKAIEDSGLRSHKFAKVCFGILIVEDLFAVVLMVLLTSIAVKNSFEGGEMIMQIGKLVGYLIIWFVIGIAIIPSFLKRFKKHLNDETLTIFSIGLCLGMVLLAVNAGFSSALGAFVIGSVLAETVEAEKIEHLVEPVKNIFGSIFFVSVGMMIDPSLLIKYWIPITVITIVVVCGQIIFASLGTLLSGQSLRVSLQTGFSLVQIGEFAFIIASLGQKLQVTDDSLYPIVVAVSVITTFLTPYIMRLAYPTLRFLDDHMSSEMKYLLDKYAEARNSKGNQKVWLSRIGREIIRYIVSLPLLKFIFSKFNDNLYAREKLAEENKTLNSIYENTLMSLDIHISEFLVPVNSKFCGKTLKELSIRSESGAVIVGIVRGEITINVPGGERHIYPNDKLVVAGTDTQMVDFQKMLDNSIMNEKTTNRNDSKLILDNITIDNTSSFIGKSIIKSGIRDKARCVVMGIVRPDEDIFMNPDPQMVIQEGDVIILVGEREKINLLKKQ